MFLITVRKLAGVFHLPDKKKGGDGRGRALMRKTNTISAKQESGAASGITMKQMQKPKHPPKYELNLCKSNKEMKF